MGAVVQSIWALLRRSGVLNVGILDVLDVLELDVLARMRLVDLVWRTFFQGVVL